jgi:hypothetical protein
MDFSEAEPSGVFLKKYEYKQIWDNTSPSFKVFTAIRTL